MTDAKKRSLRKAFVVLLIVSAVLILVPVIIIVGLRIHVAKNNYTRTDIGEYVQFADTNDVMPRLDALGETTDVVYKETQHSTLFFTSNARLLIASYDDATYESQKQAVTQTYTFEEDAFTACNHTYDARFTVDGFNFGVLSMDAYGADFPKRFYCIGTSDSEHKIVYLYFTDADLDYIPSWETFLRQYCGWT